MKPSVTLTLSLLVTLWLAPVLRAEVGCYSDNVAPVAICDAHTVVSLSNTGTAKVFATDIDDGSYDNCHLSEYLVRRMVPGWCPPGVADDTQFRPYVEFCCEDVGQTIWVILRVIDSFGNYNECMAEVTVQDNSTPNFVCPPDITVSCSFWFSNDALYNPNNRTFGTIAVNGAPRLPIIINDPGNTWFPQPHNWGLDGYAGSGVCAGGNGWITIPEVIDYRNACGVGVIKRKFYIEYGGWSDWCYQTITVKDYSNYSYTIDWPDDYMADGCLYGVEDVDPEDLPYPYNKPVINGGGWGNSCSLTGYAHEDLVFTFTEGACYKILREWTVIDWCKYQPNNPWSPGIWKHTQVIKLKNEVAPVFLNGCVDIEVPGYEPDCKGRYFEQPPIYDDCTPVEQLKWDYKIDLWMDGTYDLMNAGEGQPTVDRIIPNGWHRILWNVSDQCGNYKSCSYKVHVVDKKAPTPVCYYGLASVVMPIGGMVTIWAKDFNASSYDNCTPANKLKYSFSENILEASRTFTCDDLGTVPIQVWVHDEFGNKDYCTTFITLNDNEGACVGMHPISGTVTTFSGLAVPQTSASLFRVMPDQSMEEDESKGVSDATGVFHLGFGTTDYDRMVTLARPAKQLEGLSTLDLIALQRHVSGIERITEPHKLFAADLDGNGRVGANDLLLLRNALLGAYQNPAFQGNLAWAFFGEPCEPQASDDLLNGYCYNGVEVDHAGAFPATVAFKALKRGDVNGDMTNTAWNLTPRTSATMTLATVENPDGSVDVLASRDAEVYGLQFSLLDDKMHVLPGVLPIEASSVAVDAQGVTRISWGRKEPMQVFAGDVLFTLGNLPEGRSVGSLLSESLDDLYPEIYTEGMQNERLSFRAAGTEGNAVEGFEVKLAPNPFSDYATLQVKLPAAEKFNLAIYDMRGTELFSRQYTPTLGEAQVVISPDMVGAPGVYYYRVRSAHGELSGKFVKQ